MAHPDLEGQCVLVVEDDFLLGALVADALTEAGGEVVGPCPTVQAAFEVLEDHDVAAAVLDVNLADGNCSPIADNLARKAIPVIFYTGRAPDELPCVYRRHRIISKMAPPEQLLEALSEALP